MNAEKTIASENSAAIPNRTLWAGRITSGLVVVFLLLDSIMKLIVAQPVIDTSAQLGLPTDPARLRALGAILLGATLLYLWPRTAVLGALLLTAYLGGAVATHFRVGSPLMSHTMFGVYLGAFMWGGLWLRDKRVRGLLPLVDSRLMSAR